jgi:hypothetical protein
MLSENGHQLFVLNYKFSKANTSKSGRIRWRCCNRKCPSTIYKNVSQEDMVIEKIFSCESNMQFMCNQQIFFVDGTFDYRENRILLTLRLNTLIPKN